MKEGHINLEGIAGKTKEKNVKPQNKIKLLNEKVKEGEVSDMYSVISETKSEIAAECGFKRFFKKLWRKHIKKCWKKIKGFLYGTRFANNNEANKDLNSEKSNKLIK
ncbi:MAG: hypothetical protein IJT14_04185 [Rickettsiales bacterium]|nr:hypothetical protein [Rickettsiales bacterium]